MLALAVVATADELSLSVGDELAPTSGVVAAVSTSGVAVAEAPVLPPEGAIEVTADRLTYDRDSGWIEGFGNVVVLNGSDRLTADHVQVNMETEEADASGNVVMTRPSGVTKGDRLSFNFRTKEGQGDDLSGVADPFRWVSDTTEHVSTNIFVLRGAASC